MRESLYAWMEWNGGEGIESAKPQRQLDMAFDAAVCRMKSRMKRVKVVLIRGRNAILIEESYSISCCIIKRMTFRTFITKRR